VLKARLTGEFRREYSLMEKRRKDMAKLNKVMLLIGDEQPLPPQYKDHPLQGKYEGKRECHIEPDWLLVYRVDYERGVVIFYRTGSHADLF